MVLKTKFTCVHEIYMTVLLKSAVGVVLRRLYFLMVDLLTLALVHRLPCAVYRCNIIKCHDTLRGPLFLSCGIPCLRVILFFFYCTTVFLGCAAVLERSVLSAVVTQ